MWYKKIYNLLRAKDLLNYIQNDYLKAVEENVKNGTMTTDDLRIANKNQGVAMTIIINNISDDVYNLIEDLDTPFEVMNAIKEEYDDEKSEDTERLIKKLYTLKAKKLNQVASVLRKIKDVLTTLEKKNYTIGNMEKIRLVYYALPSELQDLKMFTGNESLDEAITKINNSVTLREFVNRGNTISCAENTKGKGKEKENEKLSKSDLMDIDFLSTPKREDNYCYICNMKGHTTKRCRYNSKEKYHKRNYKSNGKNGKNGKNRKYKNKNYYNKRNVGNIETNKNSDNFNNYYENYSDDENEQLYENQINIIENLKPINFLLGIKVEKQGYNYSISQSAYIDSILARFNVNNIRKAKTPCTGDNPGENKEPFDKTTYKSALGSLIYLAKCSRPDISYSVNKAARSAENPTISDWKKVINILKYLNSTKNYKITYNETGEFAAYTDSDLGGDIRDRKSTSGFIIVKGTKPICWASKKQTNVATSTMEAEYIATTENKKIIV